ncbi:topbp1, putative [Entamoeba dispar SAW760]|uniref:Topbp1, putative n=1 Tax=Entamoeba dispar (strain ATCC PRA-260 / SAW760) TaxID=370354 RepID=B0E6N4_ENTDS|nr:topbp1, putative [Entamoeba dispar SAW760]EDR29815.1 topbp1, putative [Entamoeba dispar SAW760]|eukprot:EDR29815.1 topbp1, putative [Entamoeba dispar SAW760]
MNMTYGEVNRPLSFLSGYVICVSGYTNEARELLKSMIELCGGIYMEDMECRSVTFLLSTNPASEKTKHAIRWGVPVLSQQWLFDCLYNQRLLSINPYLLNAKK